MSNAAKMRNIDSSYDSETWERFQCVECGEGKLVFDQGNEKIHCDQCQQVYPLKQGVLDTLVNISPDTKKEIMGMTVEAGMPVEAYDDYKVLYRDTIKTLKEKMVMTEEDYNQYYQQTWLNFEHAFQSCEELQDKWVLEIGACYDYYFLKPFQEKGANCVGLNVHFELLKGQSPTDWPAKVLGDMNKLPFQDSSFDYIVISSTSHHSNTPEVLTQEIFRVLRPGGKCLMINDPVKGLLKALGGTYEMDRHDHINENEYTIWRYNRMFRAAGFQSEHLFSRFHDLKLQNAKIHPETRFAFIARLAAGLWQRPIIRKFLKKYGLWMAQAIFGFPMNVVLTKPQSSRS